jgi:hypothetical protein
MEPFGKTTEVDETVGRKLLQRLPESVCADDHEACARLQECDENVRPVLRHSMRVTRTGIAPPSFRTPTVDAMGVSNRCRGSHHVRPGGACEDAR